MAGTITVGYARVSTRSSEQKVSIEGQVEQLRALGCDPILTERVSAYKDGPRPEWERLKALVASGQVKALYVSNQARLSRRGEDIQLFRICARLGVAVTVLDGTPVDLSDPASKLLIGFTSLANEIDSDIKAINIRNGLARRRAAGHDACGKWPFGYRYNGHQVEPCPVAFPQARKIWEQLAASEFNCSGTIRRHGLQWSQRGLNTWIDNPVLRGIVRGEPNRVEALISWEEWSKARQLLESRRKSQTRAPSTPRIFSSLVTCQGCGRRLHYHVNGGKARMKCTGPRCPFYGRGLAESKVQAQVIDALRTAATQMAQAAAVPAQASESPERIAKRTQLDQLQALQQQGVPGLEGSIEALRMDLLAPPPAPQSADWAGFRDVLLRPGSLEIASVEQLRALVLELVAEAVYVGNPDRVEIRLRDYPGNDLP
jgi:DNA invertase Pin-like site-specific DNA recombinase